MLILRLQRTGTKNKPSFRVVLAESYRAAGKKAIEILGNYNPRNKDFAIKDPERLNFWISKHVSMSPTVHNLLVEKKFLDTKKVKAWQPKKKEGDAATNSTSASTSTAATTPEVAAPTEAPAETPAA
jgi:small subunit ribosomal protein S16